MYSSVTLIVTEDTPPSFAKFGYSPAIANCQVLQDWPVVGQPATAALGSSTRPEVESDQAIIFQNAWEMRAEMIAQAAVVIKPPKGRPAEHHKSRARLPQPLELPDRRLVVSRGSPVLPVPFEKGDSAAIRRDLIGVPADIIDENECIAFWNHCRDILRHSS